MTTARSAPKTTHAPPLRFATSSAGSEPGDRLKRLRRRRRLLREELLVVLFLLLALAATVAVLANQWLASGPSSGATGATEPSGSGQSGLTAAGAHAPSSLHVLLSYISLSNLGGSP
jgi:hypothetical protein